MEKITKKTKFLFLALAFVACALVLCGIIQTFVLKSKQSNLETLQQSNSQLEQTANNLKTEHDYKNSSDYNDDYTAHEGVDEDGNRFGEDGDKVIEVE